MQTTRSRPEAHSSGDSAVAAVPTLGSVSHADVALVVAVLAPLAIIGLLVLIGFGVGAAVCIMFVLVFAVTTTMDVRWLLRRRRFRNDLRRCQASREAS